MKKILCILLMLILVFSFVACGDQQTPDEGENENGGNGETDLPNEPIYPDWDTDGTETPIIPLT